MSTRDEIMAMDADALNEAIYRAQGYEKLAWPAVPRWQKPGGFGLYTEPQYATDIAAAWELFDELRVAFFSTYLIGWDHQDKHYCVCHPRQGHGEHLPDTEGYGNTAPLAICAAWLLWKDTP